MACALRAGFPSSASSKVGNSSKSFWISDSWNRQIPIAAGIGLRILGRFLLCRGGFIHHWIHTIEIYIHIYRNIYTYIYIYIYIMKCGDLCTIVKREIHIVTRCNCTMYSNWSMFAKQFCEFDFLNFLNLLGSSWRCCPGHLQTPQRAVGLLLRWVHKPMYNDKSMIYLSWVEDPHRDP